VSSCVVCCAVHRKGANERAPSPPSKKENMTSVPPHPVPAVGDLRPTIQSFSTPVRRRCPRLLPRPRPCPCPLSLARGLVSFYHVYFPIYFMVAMSSPGRRSLKLGGESARRRAPGEILGQRFSSVLRRRFLARGHQRTAGTDESGNTCHVRV